MKQQIRSLRKCLGIEGYIFIRNHDDYCDGYTMPNSLRKKRSLSKEKTDYTSRTQTV